MRTRELSGRSVVPGRAEGLAVVTTQPISFFGGVDPEQGIIIERGHELEGQRVSGKVLIFPTGKGSTVGSYVIYAMNNKGTSPAAIINVKTEPIIAVGCILAELPLMDQLSENPVQTIKTGDRVQVLADDGVVKVEAPE